MLEEAYKRGQEAGALANPLNASQAAAADNSLPPQQQRPNAQYSVSSAQPPATTVQISNTNYATQQQGVTPIVVPSSAAMQHQPKPQPPQPQPHLFPVAKQQQLMQQPLGKTSTHKSMPDLSKLQQNPQDDEEKRQQRLSRNRASARLRRLKKKNLVDSYEAEVGILEANLAKLKAHKWGMSTTDSDHEALIEALSMERGQQPLSPEKRRELIQMIIAQQREQVGNLLECQIENWMLGALADAGLKGDGEDKNDELSELTSELQSILKLTPDQMTRIKASSEGCTHEIQDLMTMDQCLQSIHENEWLLNEGVDAIGKRSRQVVSCCCFVRYLTLGSFSTANEFTRILNPSQMSKFLAWSDHNSDSIEKLDYVNPTSAVGNGPTFEFGVYAENW